MYKNELEINKSNILFCQVWKIIVFRVQASELLYRIWFMCYFYQMVNVRYLHFKQITKEDNA